MRTEYGIQNAKHRLGFSLFTFEFWRFTYSGKI